MQAEPVPNKKWTLKQKHVLLEVFFLVYHFLFMYFFIFCENDYCRLLHLFVFSAVICGGAANYRAADSKQSSVKCRAGLKKKGHLCLNVTGITKATENEIKVRQKQH